MNTSFKATAALLGYIAVLVLLALQRVPSATKHVAAELHGIFSEKAVAASALAIVLVVFVELKRAHRRHQAILSELVDAGPETKMPTQIDSSKGRKDAATYRQAVEHHCPSNWADSC